MAITINVEPDPPVAGADLCIFVTGSAGGGAVTGRVTVDGVSCSLTHQDGDPPSKLRDCIVVPANGQTVDVMAFQSGCPLSGLGVWLVEDPSP